MKTKRMKTRYRGIEKYQSGLDGHIYYKGRFDYQKKPYRTEACLTIKRAQELLEVLVTKVKAQDYKPKQTKVIVKKNLRVKDVLTLYKNVVEELECGKTYSTRTMLDRQINLSKMISDDNYCCLNNMYINQLTNKDLVSLKKVIIY